VPNSSDPSAPPKVVAEQVGSPISLMKEVAPPTCVCVGKAALSLLTG